MTSYVEAIEEEEVTIFNDDVKNQAARRPDGRYGDGWDWYQPNFSENYPANTIACKSTVHQKPFRLEMRKNMSFKKHFLVSRPNSKPFRRA